MPAQAERILFAGGDEADSPNGDQRIELVGERHALRDRPLRQRVAGEARPVVLLDRRRDVRRLAVVLGVVTAHEALQFGKFADHVRDEVGLRELRGALRRRAIGTKHRRDRARNRNDPLHALVLRAELVVINDGLEPVDAIGQPDLAVLVEEEAGVGQARAQHAFVALDDRGGILRFDVAYDEEAMDQPAFGVGQREIFLVLLHRQDQALLRNLEECPIEGSRVDGGPFDQRRHFVEQRVGHDDRGAAGGFREPRDDPRASLGEARNHLALGAQRLVVCVRGADLDVGAALEAMAVGQVSGSEAERVYRDDRLTMQRQKLVSGPHEANGGSIGALVAHHLRNRQFRDRLVERVLQRRDERASLRDVGIEQRLDLAVGLAQQRRRIDVRQLFRLELAQQRGRRPALGVEGHADRQQLFLERLVRSDCPHVGHRHREPSRRCERRDHGFGGEEIAAGEAIGDAPRECLAERLQRLRRQLLGQELDGQRRRAARHAALRPSPAASIGKPSASRES